MDKNREHIKIANTENHLSKLNKLIYKKLSKCQLPALVIAKPAYNLAQMYIQSLDFISKSNDLSKITKVSELVEKIVELRESVKSLRYYSEQFGRSYYVLMDKLNSLTEEWLEDEEDDFVYIDDSNEVSIDSLKNEKLKNGLLDEIKAHNQRQFKIIVKTLISKGCQEDIANYFAENLFELQFEARNLIAFVDRLVTLPEDGGQLVYDVEEIMLEISIPWVGFSPGETAHALWHIGNHDEDNFFFMGFLGWSLAVLESLQANTENI